jgi:hypothetical protein
MMTAIHVFLFVMPSRMRRVMFIAAIMALLCKDKDPNTLNALAKEVNEERNIADSTDAFDLGYWLSLKLLGKLKEQIQRVTDADWISQTMALIKPWMHCDRKMIEEDLNSIKSHILQ